MVRKTKTHSRTSQQKAAPYQPKQKNRTGQDRFTSNCQAYKHSAPFRSSLGVSLANIKYAAAPIIKYSSVHATGKTQAGGDKGGCSSAENVFIPSMVKYPVKLPNARGTAIFNSNAFQRMLKKITPRVVYSKGVILCNNRSSYKQNRHFHTAVALQQLVFKPHILPKSTKYPFP